MRVHFKVSAGIPEWDDRDALTHGVTLTARGAMIHMGEAVIEGTITVWRQDDHTTRRVEIDPDLVAAVRDLGELAESEILANLTAGRDADGETLEIEDEPEEPDPHAGADFDRRLDTMESAAARADRGAYSEEP